MSSLRSLSAIWPTGSQSPRAVPHPPQSARYVPGDGYVCEETNPLPSSDDDARLFDRVIFALQSH